MVTQMPTWLWISDAYWSGPFVARASTSSGRVWAEARAHPVAVSWQPGDGSTISCGPGTPWQAGAGSAPSSCSHTYRHSSAGTSGLPLSVSVTFEVEGVTSLGSTVPVGQITRTSAAVLVQVTEIQAIETNGR